MPPIDLSALLSASVGKISVGDILTAVIVLVVCLVAVRPLGVRLIKPFFNRYGS